MWRISPQGLWQRLLPGVLAAHRGIPTRHERLLAAMKYAGPQSMLTGAPGTAALLARGVDGLEWNIELWTRAGEFVGSPDAYCVSTGVALQVDSMKWHLRPQGYQRTQARQRGLAYWGIFVLPWSPADALANPDEVALGLIRLRDIGAQRPAPDPVVRGHAA